MRSHERMPWDKDKIIVSGLVDDAQQPVFLGVDVTQRDVDFSQLERRRVAIVVDTNDQSVCLRLCHGSCFSQQVLDLEFLAPDPRGFVTVHSPRDGRSHRTTERERSPYVCANDRGRRPVSTARSRGLQSLWRKSRRWKSRPESRTSSADRVMPHRVVNGTNFQFRLTRRLGCARDLPAAHGGEESGRP